jgi:lipopolysaccharide export system protein LptA
VRWQKIARILIASFVIVFAGVVAFYMRRGAALVPTSEEVIKVAEGSVTETDNGFLDLFRHGKGKKISYKKWVTFGDGRNEFLGVQITIPDKDGKPLLISADKAEASKPPDQQQEITLGKLTGNVKLRTEAGVEVRAQEATYNEKDGMLTIPGAVEFTKGRMTGSGVGATYNRNNDVLWILANAQVHVTPDEKGAGALESSAGSAGLARADNYMKLVTAARIVSDGRTAEANEITIRLDDTGQKIQALELREQSRMTGGTSGGAQAMNARNIDLGYAPDGRTLQTAKLMENAVVELPGPAGAAPRRVSGVNIDIGMSPDGATVTSLAATDRAQVDLPAEGETPARQIKSATLRATGAPGQGIQNAVFEGGATYTESRPANAKAAASERKASSLRLIVDTKPGFGAIERADFRGNAHFEDGRSFADAPRAIYTIDKDMLDLSPGENDPGKIGPTLRNAQLTVDARNIHVSPSTQKISADTKVRGTIQPQKQGRGDANQTRMPAMLKRDSPVYVSSNRLEYDGVSEATYRGNASLWQGSDSRIDGDTLVLNDKTGNLKASIRVTTRMMLMDNDPRTRQRKPTVTTVTSDELVYDDAKRTAIYTVTGETLARMVSPQANVTGRRIDLFLKEGGNELERAEADTTVTVVMDKLFATGRHLVYTAATDIYVLVGEPTVSVQKDEKGSCKETQGATMTYDRAKDSADVVGIGGLVPFNSKPVDPCPAALRN